MSDLEKDEGLEDVCGDELTGGDAVGAGEDGVGVVGARDGAGVDEVWTTVAERCTLGGATLGVDTSLGGKGGDDCGEGDVAEVADSKSLSVVVPNASAIFCRAIKVGSPACNEGQMLEGGFFNKDTRSVTDCCKKSSRVTFGKGIS